MIGAVLRVRYELTGALADGPIFTTYSARDRTLGREVCVRLLKPPFNHEQDFVALLREAVRKVAGLQHPNVEILYDVEEHEGNVFIVSELTRGPSLADRIRKLAPFSVPVSVGMAISILQALDTVHKAGIVHGDLSTQNVAVLGDGQAKLQMSGIWRAYSGSPTAGSIVLPAMAPYLAPEVSGGDMPSAHSDIYAVGVVLFELLTGRQPYYADTALATATKHRTQPTPSVRSNNPSVPVVLDEIVKRAMDKDPAHRYASAAEMLADLRILQDALRFGRALTWPLRADGRPNPAQAEPQPVTPRMSAVRSEKEAEALPRRARQERDVPVWMLVVITALGAVVLSLLGVWMVFNMKSPRLIDVPKLRGLSVQEATDVLASNHLVLERGQQVTSSTIPSDHVIDSTPEAGQKVREGGNVLVSISAGSRYVKMPDVRNMTLDKARSVLSSLDLDIDLPIQNLPSESVPVNNVARQLPAPNQSLERNSKVRLYISSGPKQSDGAPDEGSAIYQYNLHVTVSDVPDTVEVRIDIVDSESPEGRTLTKEQRSAGEEFDVSAESTSKKVQFKIYYNGEEVSSIDKAYDPSGGI